MVNMKEILRDIEGSADDCINLHDSDIYNDAASEQTPSYNLKFYRKLNGLTQKELAEKLGKRPSEISEWLTGNHNFTDDTLFLRQVIKSISKD